MTATTMHTGTGQLVGTLAYMSPEQCDGDPHELDMRTDVYSLGVVLYELLCGRMPYDLSRTNIYAAIRAIREAAPQPPRAVMGSAGVPTRKCSRDLEAIVLKAIEKDRRQRYAGVADFAADIRRHLAGDPIAARKPTAWAKGVRWVARHPLPTLSFMLVLVVSLTMIAASIQVARFARESPYRIELLPDGHAVQLVSRTGEPLREWTGGKDGRFEFAEMVRQPKALGGRRIALIGVSARATISLPIGLSAIDVDGDLSRPLWHNCVQDEEIPTALRKNRGFVGAEYRLPRAILADVFPDKPCPQVVAAFAGDYTHTSLRVIDLAGNVLSEVWVDAHVQSMHWMSGLGLLVIVGLNGEVTWEDRGYHADAGTHPNVLFAIRPELGRVREYVVQEGDPPPETNPALVPAWYRCLMLNRQPPTALLRGVSLDPPRASRPATDHVQVGLVVASSYPTAGANVHWVFDSAGKIVDGPTPSDGYQRNQSLPDADQRKLPPVEAWQWAPLPPRQAHIKEGPSVWKPGDNKRPTATQPAAPSATSPPTD